MSEQMLLSLGQVLALPLSPRAMGRIASRNGVCSSEIPFPCDSAQGIEWMAGFGLARGIPDTIHGQSHFLRDQWLKMYDVLAEIRDDARVPADLREKARRRLAREDDELKEG